MADTNPLRDTFTVILGDELARLGMDMPVTARVIAARLDDVLARFIGDGLLDANGQRWTRQEVQTLTVDNDGVLRGRTDLPNGGYIEWTSYPVVLLERSETDQ